MTQVTLNNGSVDSAGSLLLKTNGTTTAVTIDTAQNMGLGVTPSAFSGGKAIEIGAAGNAFNGYEASNILVSSGAYYNGGWKYANSSYGASLYQQYRGTHNWQIAASGTAGNAITFTQAMTLDASGNLLVGTTTPFLNTSGRGLINVNGSSSSAIAFGVGGTRYGHIYCDTAELAIANGAGASGFIDFQTNGSERARIDSSGNLLVGTTTSGADQKGFQVLQYGSGTYTRTFHANGAASGDSYAVYSYNGTQIGSISQNGTTAVAYNTTSDYRLKENVQPLSGALARVAALKPCTYTWKSAPDEIGEGFIAHELAEVCPQAVTGEKDAVNEDGSIKPQSIDTSFLVAPLTAAIQEQQAIIIDLTNRITALEGAQA